MSRWDPYRTERRIQNEILHQRNLPRVRDQRPLVLVTDIQNDGSGASADERKLRDHLRKPNLDFNAFCLSDVRTLNNCSNDRTEICLASTATIFLITDSRTQWDSGLRQAYDEMRQQPHNIYPAENRVQPFIESGVTQPSYNQLDRIWGGVKQFTPKDPNSRKQVYTRSASFLTSLGKYASANFPYDPHGWIPQANPSVP
jgi:hypothetical protein